MNMAAFTLSRTLSVTGDITADEDLVVEGTVSGSIKVPEHAIVIGPAAQIKGDVLARVIDVRGRVDSNVVASERAVLRAGSHVSGRVVSPRLVVEEGAVIDGQLDSRNTDAAISVAKYRAGRP
jgi:cytoskeletal protein CcmA (bactofilin family)